ncbi:MAG: hypothetical protein FLDDKLPJ_01000 [Phycisphaerae bacterium]|nr:hypothetical protein [Phycisphaerae bacterium]
MNDGNGARNQAGRKRGSRMRRPAGAAAALTAMALASGGCDAGNAVADGLYIGVSDTVAAIVMSILLGER